MFEVAKECPVLICERCEEELAVAIKLKKVSLASDLYLKSIESSVDLNILLKVINNDENEVVMDMKIEPPDDYFYEYLDEDLMKIDSDPSPNNKNCNPDGEYDIKEDIKLKKNANKKNKGDSLIRPKRLRAEPITCEFPNCFKTFTKPSRLRDHQIVHHLKVEPIHQCEICGKKFTLRLYLRQHKKRHLDINYTCDLCGAVLRSGKMSILKHMRVSHLKSTKTMCNICGKPFSCINSLRNHLPTHDPVRKHQCGICEAKFATKNKLERHHNMVHESNRPFECPVCKKCYAKRHLLNDHMKFTHKQKLKEQKKFACILCGNSFERANVLHQHLRNRHQVVQDFTE